MPVLFEAPSQPPRKTSKKRKRAVETFTTPLTAYLMHPSDIRFETQEENEDVILFMRQHIIILLPKLLLGIIMLFAPLIVFPFFIRFLHTPIEIPGGYIIVGTVFWYVASFGYLLTMFMQWFFNIFIVTNHRIIDIDFLFLLYKKLAEARLERIQDVSFRTGGIMATMFNFGDVMIQTAGELPNFVFEKVPRPSDVVHIIGDLIQNGRKKEYL